MFFRLSKNPQRKKGQAILVCYNTYQTIQLGSRSAAGRRRSRETSSDYIHSTQIYSYSINDIYYLEAYHSIITKMSLQYRRTKKSCIKAIKAKRRPNSSLSLRPPNQQRPACLPTRIIEHQTSQTKTELKKVQVKLIIM